MTPIGRLRYACAPQCALCSGDGYNQRFETVIADFHDKERNVDDAIFWDANENMENHWWRNIDFIELCGHNGIVLNSLNFNVAVKQLTFLASV